MPESRQLVNPQLAAAMAHPTRLFAMRLLYERPASPREIAAEMGEPLNNVTYHVNQLRKLGCIELVDTRPAHGGRVIERLYRATRRLMFDNDEWAELSDGEKATVLAGLVRLFSEDLSEAVSRGTMYDPGDGHMSRSPMALDRKGWGEANAILDKALEDLFAVQERVLDRRRAGECEGEDLYSRVHMVHLRCPEPKQP